MWRPAIAWAIGVAVALVLPLALSPFFIVLVIEIAVVALFATSFNLLMGFGGMVSFGQAAYFALGAYAAALLAQKAGWPMLAALAAAPVVAGLGALVFGFFIVRLTHTYFAMLSLAFGQIVYTIIFKWTSLTGGDNGLLDVWPPAFLRSQTAYYYFALLVIASCFLALHNGSVFPDFAFFTKSFEPLVVVLLGGMQSFWGPLAGAFGFKFLEWLISTWAP